MSSNPLLTDFQNCPPGRLIGWDSKDLTEGVHKTWLATIREVRQDFYRAGFTSKMRHFQGMYLVMFNIAGGDALDSMKMNLAVIRLKQCLETAKSASVRLRARPEGKLRVEQVPDEKVPDVESLLAQLDVDEILEAEVIH